MANAREIRWSFLVGALVPAITSVTQAQAALIATVERSLLDVTSRCQDMAIVTTTELSLGHPAEYLKNRYGIAVPPFRRLREELVVLAEKWRYLEHRTSEKSGKTRTFQRVFDGHLLTMHEIGTANVTVNDRESAPVVLKGRLFQHRYLSALGVRVPSRADQLGQCISGVLGAARTKWSVDRLPDSESPDWLASAASIKLTAPVGDSVVRIAYFGSSSVSPDVGRRYLGWEIVRGGRSVRRVSFDDWDSIHGLPGVITSKRFSDGREDADSTECLVSYTHRVVSISPAEVVVARDPSCFRLSREPGMVVLDGRRHADPTAVLGHFTYVEPHGKDELWKRFTARGSTSHRRAGRRWALAASAAAVALILCLRFRSWRRRSRLDGAR